MVVLSVLRATEVGLRGLKAPICRNPSVLKAWQPRGIVPSCARGMGGKRTMEIMPTKYEWTKWKDHIHFYTALGLIPMGILIFGVNVFIGRAELTEIPEGYEPKHWEYFRHPFERWFARYVYDSPEKGYEKNLHMINHASEKARINLLEKKVRRLMAERGDYKGWYYVPARDQQVYVSRIEEEERELTDGVR